MNEASSKRSARRRRLCTGALLGLGLATLGAPPRAATSLLDKLRGKDAAEPLPPEQAFNVRAEWADPNTVRLKFFVTANYYLYRERMLVALKDSPGRRIVSIGYPPTVTKNDPSFGKMAVYTKSFDVPVKLEGAASKPVSLLVRYQGCYETIGICYPPETVTIQPQ